MHRRANFRVFYFQDGSHLPTLICWMQIWSTHNEFMMVFYNCAKFGWNWCSSFLDTKILIFLCVFKNEYSQPKIMVLGADP